MWEVRVSQVKPQTVSHYAVRQWFPNTETVIVKVYLWKFRLIFTDNTKRCLCKNKITYRCYFYQKEQFWMKEWHFKGSKHTLTPRTYFQVRCGRVSPPVGYKQMTFDLWRSPSSLSVPILVILWTG